MIEIVTGLLSGFVGGLVGSAIVVWFATRKVKEAMQNPLGGMADGMMDLNDLEEEIQDD